MAPSRIIILTGKGGSGASTLAAATAAAIAAADRQTLAFGLGPGLSACDFHDRPDQREAQRAFFEKRKPDFWAEYRPAAQESSREESTTA